MSKLETGLLKSVLKKYRVPRGMVLLAQNHPDRISMDASCRDARLQPKFRFVKRIIDSGVLGEIYYIHHNSVARQFRPGIEYHPAAKWFLSKNIAGGGLKFAYLTWDSNEVEYYYTTRDGRGKAKSKTLKVNMEKHVNDHYALSRHFVNTILKGKKNAMPLSLVAKHLNILFEVYKACS
jgi:hypothetical protein